MAADIDRSDQTRLPRFLHPVVERFGVLRRNIGQSRNFTARRRPDRRFRLYPFDGLQTINGFALIASGWMALVILLDPHLVAWHATLSEGLVRFFDIVTDFGKSGWILIGSGVFLIVSLFLDAASLPARRRMRSAIRTAVAGYIFLAVACSGIISSLIKQLVGRARPRLFEDEGAYAFDPISGDSDWASFPSGHATIAMSLGVALALLFPRLRWVSLCLGFWIAVSRMFVRAHYPSDVLAGCLLGGVTAWLLARALARRRLVFGFDEKGRLHRRLGASGRLF